MLINNSFFLKLLTIIFKMGIDNVNAIFYNLIRWVAEIDFEGITYKLEEYSKVAKELLKGFYYLAVGDNEGRMLVSPIRLPSVALAALALKTGLSVYSPDQTEAYAAAQLASNGLAPVLDPAHKDGYFAHYHAFGRPKPSSHAFYGIPTTKGSYL